MLRPVLGRIYGVLHLLRRAWWRTARPRTHGVRVLIRDANTGAVLLVRHTYGARERWYPPGGGYDPRHEDPADAARREVREEVGLELGQLGELGVWTSDAGGNRDTVILYVAESLTRACRPSAEIAETRWFTATDLRSAPDTSNVTNMANVTKACLDRARQPPDQAG